MEEESSPEGASKPLSSEDVIDLTVDELRQVLESHGIETKALNKGQMQKLLLKFLSMPVISKEELKLKSKALELKMQKELDIQKEERSFELRKLEIAAEQAKIAAENEKAKIAAEAEIEKAKLAADKAKFEPENAKFAKDNRRLDAEQAKIAADTELEKKRIEARLKNETDQFKYKLDSEETEKRRQREAEETKLRIEKEEKDAQRAHELAVIAVKIVPPFDDKNIEHFLINFEKTMAIHDFPKDKWAALLSTKLSGKAGQVFAEFSLEECQDYEILKQAVLVAYQKVPEFYRQRFRNTIKGDLETYYNYAFRLGIPFKSWLQGEEAFEDLPRLLEVIKIEQFSKCLPNQLHKWIVDKHPKTLLECAKLADEYNILYRAHKVQTPSSPKFERRDHYGAQNSETRNFSNASKTNNGENGKFKKGVTSKSASKKGFSSVTCGYCHRHNHTIGQCEKLKAVQNRSGQNQFGDR